MQNAYDERYGPEGNDWRIESCAEEIIDCDSGGEPHLHAASRMIARKEG